VGPERLEEERSNGLLVCTFFWTGFVFNFQKKREKREKRKKKNFNLVPSIVIVE
jgi:hypothetical protein